MTEVVNDDVFEASQSRAQGNSSFRCTHPKHLSGIMMLRVFITLMIVTLLSACGGKIVVSMPGVPYEMKYIDSIE